MTLINSTAFTCSVTDLSAVAECSRQAVGSLLQKCPKGHVPRIITIKTYPLECLDGRLCVFAEAEL